MKKKLCLLMALVCCVAVFAVAFAACNDNGGKSGNGGGAGDVIFTEEASLEDILTALENAESWTYTYDYAVRDPEEIERQAREIAENTQNMLHYSLDSTTVYADGTTDRYFSDNYEFAEGDMVYMIDSYRPSGEETEIDGTKCMSKYSGFSTAVISANFVEMIEYMLTEKDGKVVFNEAVMKGGYIAGSGYVVLEGDVLRIGYKEQIGTRAQEYEYRISGINATTVTVPTEIAAEKANASWQDSVYYNGVNYEKGTDAEGKEYYYVFYKDNESAVPETTINTLPVKERE